jgi:hypothetical protein
MKRILIVASIVQMLFISNAYSAGPYDGEWTGSATSTSGRRCKPAKITITVQGKVATGQARFEVDTPNINGTVREDGSFGATLGWQPLTGQFSQDGFQGTFKNSDCEWHVSLGRKK